MVKLAQEEHKGTPSNTVHANILWRLARATLELAQHQAFPGKTHMMTYNSVNFAVQLAPDNVDALAMCVALVAMELASTLHYNPIAATKIVRAQTARASFVRAIQLGGGGMYYFFFGQLVLALAAAPWAKPIVADFAPGSFEAAVVKLDIAADAALLAPTKHLVRAYYTAIALTECQYNAAALELLALCLSMPRALSAADEAMVDDMAHALRASIQSNELAGEAMDSLRVTASMYEVDLNAE
ncbi:Aste57867_17930 [Aphanomyces stellatus]|uniref:Aste57867_17930 protein n=1 Tax=Aphanomyces stellatus TaxID=120398 RepID=A0A485L910_9STRA|nr:hypothetical protein As57867_017868 [Aphanomyces stellatus]VFT94671.1 Aste57867_17930 [Aphanomyces stellatus]